MVYVALGGLELTEHPPQVLRLEMAHELPRTSLGLKQALPAPTNESHPDPDLRLRSHEELCLAAEKSNPQLVKQYRSQKTTKVGQPGKLTAVLGVKPRATHCMGVQATPTKLPEGHSGLRGSSLCDFIGGELGPCLLQALSLW